MRRGLIESRTPPEWNIRVLTLDDFYTYCDQEQIIVCEDKLKQPGLNIVCDDQSHIIIDRHLRGADRLFVCFHELGHIWLHPPGIQHFHQMESVAETEADVIAACAMIPLTVLNHYHPSEIDELYACPNWMINFRREVFDRWKI